MQQNTPQLWDEFWRDARSPEQDVCDLAKEELGIRWQRIGTTLGGRFGSFKGLKIIEIGAGAGTNAALVARRGAEVTILDYSEKALERSRQFFERNDVAASFVRADALNLPAELCNAFDVAMSFGLTEHFTGEERVRINLAHFDLLKPGGVAFIAVPNKYNPPYRLYKLVSQAIGRWAVGAEYPYSRAEFRRILAARPEIEYSFFGDSLAGSFHFVNPFKAYRKLRGLPEPTDVSRLKKQRGTPLDAYCGYSLVLCGIVRAS